MEKYLIALDMDGTLLNSKKEICPKTKEYLKHLASLGHIVVIASGRPIRAIKRYYDELELTTPLVCYNGADILSPNDPNFKEISFAFPHEVIKQIYNDVGNEYIENVMCETNKELWIIKDDPTLESFFWTDQMEIIKGDITKTLNQDPMTMIMKSYSKEYDQKIIDAIKKHPELHLRFWNGMYSLYSEIYFKDISKATGLKHIAKYYQIPYDHIIAIGDASNDVEMFQLAGISIAMKNSDDFTKSHAKIITPFDNDNDGIMYALKEIIK